MLISRFPFVNRRTFTYRIGFQATFFKMLVHSAAWNIFISAFYAKDRLIRAVILQMLLKHVLCEISWHTAAIRTLYCFKCAFWFSMSFNCPQCQILLRTAFIWTFELEFVENWLQYSVDLPNLAKSSIASSLLTLIRKLGLNNPKFALFLVNDSLNRITSR